MSPSLVEFYENYRLWRHFLNSPIVAQNFEFHLANFYIFKWRRNDFKICNHFYSASLCPNLAIFTKVTKFVQSFSSCEIVSRILAAFRLFRLAKFQFQDESSSTISKKNNLCIFLCLVFLFLYRILTSNYLYNLVKLVYLPELHLSSSYTLTTTYTHTT